MSLRNTRVLITGGTGFIGSQLARACVNQGAQVICLVRSGSNPWRFLEALPHIQRIEVDLESGPAVMAAVQNSQPEIIFHLAANTLRKRDLQLYETLHATHADATRHLVNAALALPNPPRFIHTGTIEEYGRGPVPYREDQREMLITPYSLTKGEATQIVMYAAREHGLSAVVLRPSLTYGPLKGKGMFVPDFIRAALTTREFNMSPGEQTRDLIYVDDVVRAFLLVAEAENTTGEIFNVATGVETKLKDVAERLHVLCGGNVKVNYGAYSCDPRIETMRCFMDIQKIRQQVSWQPQVDLEEGLAKTVAWYRDEAGPYEEYLW